MTDAASIQAFASRIAERFRPDRIVLFGSHATGKANADSDVDLLVVMPHDGKPWRRATEIRGAVRPGFPVDLLVRSSEELEARIAMGDCFLREIVTTGQVLYEAPDN
jgi:predicted nucleotidyltransferase